MIGEDIDDQIEEEVAAIEPAKVLLGFLQQPEAIRWLQSSKSLVEPIPKHKNSDDEIQDIREERQEEYIERYEAACSSIESPPNFTVQDVELRDLPESQEIEDHLQEFSEQEHFQELSRRYENWEFKLVPIRSLVAFQKSVTTTAYNDIPTSDDGWLDVIEYTLPVQGNNYLMNQQIGSSDGSFKGVQFTSRGPNIDIHGPEVTIHDEDEQASHSVTFQIVPNPNFVIVSEYGGRFILKNGYHRCTQLMQSGEEFVPAFVFQASSLHETGAVGGNSFREDLLYGPRPPLVSDFGTEAAAEINSPGTNTVLRILAETTQTRR